MSFEHKNDSNIYTGHYSPRVEMTENNTLRIFDRPVKSIEVSYENLRKIVTDLIDNYTVEGFSKDVSKL